MPVEFLADGQVKAYSRPSPPNSTGRGWPPARPYPAPPSRSGPPTSSGKPPLTYLTWPRMTGAARLLWTPARRWPPSPAGQLLVSYVFGKAFRREYGVAAGRYRRRTGHRTPPGAQPARRTPDRRVLRRVSRVAGEPPQSLLPSASAIRHIRAEQSESPKEGG